METIVVKSKTELFSIGKELAKKHARILLRGQVLDRPLVPTMFRGNHGSSDKLPGCIPHLTANWSVTAEKIVKEFRGSHSSSFETQAVMQHYGYRSTLIDVTSSLKIALWFALHKFESNQAPFFINNQLRSAVFQWARYVPSRLGYVYILRLPDQPDQQYIDLTRIMPIAARRIHNQKAGGIACSSELTSAENLVIAKLVLNDNGWFKGSKADLPMSELFPAPSIDEFYGKLCTIPYYVTPIRGMEKVELGHPLLGMFPIYAESIKELLKEYSPLTTIVQTRPSLKWNIASGGVECENNRFKVRNAQRISISRLLVDLIIKDFHKVNDLNGFPARNLIFEFEPEASLFSPSSKALDKVILGIWVVFGAETLNLAEIVDNFTDVFFNSSSSYSLKEKTWIQKSSKHDDYYLQMLQAVSALLITGSLEIKKADELYFKVSYKERKSN